MKCGIDPGRYKIGMALAEDGKLLFSAIIPKAEEEQLRRALAERDWQLLAQWQIEGSYEEAEGKDLEMIYVGNGTSSVEVLMLLQDNPLVESVDEKGSTLEGRRLYWLLHPPKGLWRLIPVSMRVPPRDIDDLAAWSLIGQL